MTTGNDRVGVFGEEGCDIGGTSNNRERAEERIS